MTWLIIIAIAGAGGVKDVQFHMVQTEAQCRVVIDELAMLRPYVGAACIGPDGQVYNTDMVTK